MITKLINRKSGTLATFKHISANTSILMKDSCSTPQKFGIDDLVVTVLLARTKVQLYNLR